MVTDVKWTYCGDHFAKYTGIESLHSTPKTSIMLCHLFTIKMKET